MFVYADNAATTSVSKTALDAKLATSAAPELIRDTMGEKPKDAVEVSGAGSVRFVFGSGEEEDDISG